MMLGFRAWRELFLTKHCLVIMSFVCFSVELIDSYLVCMLVNCIAWVSAVALVFCRAFGNRSVDGLPPGRYRHRLLVFDIIDSINFLFLYSSSLIGPSFPHHVV